MTTIQWRPVVNALTKPQSYRPQFVSRGTAGYDEMAADLSAAHPNYNADLLRSVAPLIMDWIEQRMSSGWQVTFQDAFTFSVSLIGRMAGPDDPLPADDNLLQVNAYPSRPFEQAVRQAAQLERLPMNEKLPLITSAEDTKLKLADVLNPDAALRLTGSNLWFDENDPDCGCVLTGTQNGTAKQSNFVSVSNAEIVLLPDIPAQDNPWNNEYTLSLTTQYTEHGTPRTGIYRRRLRTPLQVDSLAADIGILTGDGSAAAYVTITGGAVSADERLRIQAVFDPLTDRLLFNLLDMKEGGAAGAELPVAANGTFTVQGFSGSAVSAMEIAVADYAALKTLIRNHYSGRLVDILEVTVA